MKRRTDSLAGAAGLDPSFVPSHISVTPEDCVGNGRLGRFWIVPGSMSRAQFIADRYLTDVVVRTSGRGHHAHLGKISAAKLNWPGDQELLVGVMSTGMGAPSVDITITELIKAGARVLVRVGTAGAVRSGLQVGDLVVASGAVRDEGTTRHYMPLEFPALASSDIVAALNTAAYEEQDAEATKVRASNAPGMERRPWMCECGPVHSKDSLMAREFKCGPLASHHEDYMETLANLGCVASEMECACLFTLGQVYGVKAGAVLGIIGGGNCPIVDDKNAKEIVEDRCARVTVRALLILGTALVRCRMRAADPAAVAV